MSKTFYMVTSIVLFVAFLALVLVGVWLFTDRAMYKSQLENVYQKSFFDLVADVGNIEVKLDKVAVASSASYQKEILYELWRQADIAQANLAELSVRDNTIVKTTAYINQLSDYSKHLANRLEDGGAALSAEEKTSLRALSDISARLGAELNDLQGRLGTDFMFIDNYTQEDSIYFEQLNSNVEADIEYPSLIYDGPFSDAVQNKQPKLIGDEVDSQTAEAYLVALYGEDMGELEYQGEQSGKIATHNFETNDTIVQVTVLGGRLIMQNTRHESEQQQYSEEQCIDIASEFVKTAGYDGMEHVWISNYGGVMYINFVYKEGDVLCYADMIKVKVASDIGKVIGFEAQPYAYNHEQRTIPTPLLTEDEVRLLAPKGMTLESVALALVPKGERQILTYELYGQLGGDYFVYVDASSGDEVNILKVIDSDNGRLLL